MANVAYTRQKIMCFNSCIVLVKVLSYLFELYLD